MRVLVVDDDPTIRDMLLLVLELEGFEVRVADNGAAGLLAVQEWTPDVVVIDVAMPEIDGWGFVRQLRGDPGLRGPPVVFCTALTDDESTGEGWRLGAASYVAKPFHPYDLVGEVAWLRRSVAWSGSSMMLGSADDRLGACSHAAGGRADGPCDPWQVGTWSRCGGRVAPVRSRRLLGGCDDGLGA